MRNLTAKHKTINHLTTFTNGRVKFNEADPLGVVWHGNYIEYFEECREDFDRKHGVSYLDIYQHEFATPIIEFHCYNKFPLRYGDTYTTKTMIVSTSAAKMIFLYQIFNQDNVLVCEGETVQVFVHNINGLSLYVPDFYRIWKEKVKFDE